MPRTSTTSRLPLKTKSNKALNFAVGTTAVVAVSDVAALRPETTGIFTWTAWLQLFKPNSNVLPRIIEKGGHFFCIMGDQSNARRNQLALEVLGNDSITTEYWGSTRLKAHRWYHVATVFNAGTCQHYVNGVAETMTTLLGPFVAPLFSSSGSTFKVGNRNSNSRNFPGLISDVRMYNTALTQADIQRIIAGEPVTSGLVGKWNFDEGSGASAIDGVSANNGTITAATWENVVNARSAAGTRAAA